MARLPSNSLRRYTACSGPFGTCRLVAVQHACMHAYTISIQALDPNFEQVVEQHYLLLSSLHKGSFHVTKDLARHRIGCCYMCRRHCRVYPDDMLGLSRTTRTLIGGNTTTVNV